VRKLAHSGVKTLRSLIDLMEFFEIDKSGGLHDSNTRQAFSRSLRALTQLIQDFRLLAVCDEAPPESWVPINWKSIIGEKFGSRAAPIPLSIDEGDYNGRGQPELFSAAIGNLAWFAKGFWNDSVKAHLGLVQKGDSSWVQIRLEMGPSLKVEQDFSALTPFHPMFPQESLALDKSTGLVLFAARRVIEVHGGSLVAECTPNGLNLTATYPKISDKNSIIR